MSVIIYAQQKVIGLYVAMNNLPLVDELYPFDHLVPYHQGALETHYFVVLDEDVLDASAQQVHQHNIVLAFGGNGSDFGYSNHVLC